MVELPGFIIAAAQASQAKWRVPASVDLAQYGDESAWGKVVTGSYNFFGIKALPGQPSAMCWTHEWNGVKFVRELQPFRVYASAAEAFDDHGRLLAQHYPEAMACLPDIPAFVAVMAKRYATDPGYAEKIIAIITDEQLTRYDTLPAPQPGPKPVTDTNPNAQPTAIPAPTPAAPAPFTATKPVLASTTVAGGLIATVGGVLALISPELPQILGVLGFNAPQAAEIVAAVGALATVAGGVQAIIGRLRARTILT
jgi:hypothetical protein